jgi:glutamate carboxypeptidase
MTGETPDAQGGDSLARLLDEARDRLPEWIELLRRIVDVDSGPGDVRGINEVYDRLIGMLAPLGFDFQRHPTPGPDVIHGRRTDTATGPRLLLVGHADTVFPSGTVATRPMRVEGDRVTGPGVADMKGGLVVAVAGLLIAGAGTLDRLAIEILVNGDEESGSLHSRSTIESLAADADAVLVFEPGRPESGVVTSRRGAHRFEVAVSGRPAHTGVNPADGANAIEAAAHHVLAIQELGRRTPGGTVTAVMIHGGSRPNIVPDSATIRVDSRFDDDTTESAIVEAIGRLAGAGPVAGTRTVVRSLDQRPAFPRRDGGWFDRYRTVATLLGLDVSAESTGGSSDGNFTASLGIPTLDGLGAVGGGYHTSDEFIHLDSLATRAAMLAAVLDNEARGLADSD